MDSVSLVKLFSLIIYFPHLFLYFFHVFILVIFRSLFVTPISHHWFCSWCVFPSCFLATCLLAYLVIFWIGCGTWCINRNYTRNTWCPSSGNMHPLLWQADRTARWPSTSGEWLSTTAGDILGLTSSLPWNASVSSNANLAGSLESPAQGLGLFGTRGIQYTLLCCSEGFCLDFSIPHCVASELGKCKVTVCLSSLSLQPCLSSLNDAISSSSFPVPSTLPLAGPCLDPQFPVRWGWQRSQGSVAVIITLPLRGPFSLNFTPSSLVTSTALWHL